MLCQNDSKRRKHLKNMSTLLHLSLYFLSALLETKDSTDVSHRYIEYGFIADVLELILMRINPDFELLLAFEIINFNGSSDQTRTYENRDIRAEAHLGLGCAVQISHTTVFLRRLIHFWRRCFAKMYANWRSNTNNKCCTEVRSDLH